MRAFVLILGLVFSVYAEDFAVVVGIDNYQSKLAVSPLKGANNDAKIFRSLLLNSGFNSKNITLLLDRDATKKGIRDALIEIEKKISKDRGDRFYYFHAGHGAKLDVVKERDNNLRKTAVLIPYDFSPNDVNSYIITQRDLLPLFKKIDAKVAFGMLSFDSCFSGYAYRGLRDVQSKKRYHSRYFKGKIAIGKNFNLSSASKEYPYKNLISLMASSPTKESLEDEEAKRGIFSMALEYCLKENKVTKEDGLRSCLDRKYLKHLYMFKTPSRKISTDILKLDHKPIQNSKFIIQSNIAPKELSSLAKFVKYGTHDFELSREGKHYKIVTSPTGVTINSFSNLKAVKKFLSNYRLIALKGRYGSDIDIKVAYSGSQQGDADIVPIKSNLKIKVNSKSKKVGVLALFSLNKEGRLFMLEPNSIYRDFGDGTVVEGESASDNGVDFLKVMVFEKENALKDIKVNEDTGEVFEGQMEKILAICRANGFYGVTRKTIVSKGAR